MRVAMIGDVHGDLAGLAGVLARAADRGAQAAIQLGDLGFREDLLGPGRAWPRMPIPVLALCGNHEDHHFLVRAQATGLIRRWAEQGLIYQPRASLARLGGRTVGFLGGALHADRPQENRDRRRVGNVITDAEVDVAVLRFSQAAPDLIATHSCPAGIGVGMRGSSDLAMTVATHVVAAGFDPGPGNDCGEPGLASIWRNLPRRPAWWVFGHFHVHHDCRVAGTRFLCVPAIDVSQNLLMWDTVQGTMDWL